LLKLDLVASCFRYCEASLSENDGPLAKLLLGLGDITQQCVYLGGARVSRIDAHYGLPGLQCGGLAA